MAKKGEGGFKAPKTEAEAYAMAMDYLRGINRAGRAEERFYARERRRVPTKKEIEAKINEYLAPAEEGLVDTVSDTAGNIASALGSLGGGVAEQGSSLATSLGNMAGSSIDAMRRALALEKGKIMLGAETNAAAQRSAARTAQMQARVNRQRGLADWLGAYGSFAGMMNQGGGYGGYYGSGENEAGKQSPFLSRAESAEQMKDPAFRWNYTPNEAGDRLKPGGMWTKRKKIDDKGTIASPVAGGLPGLNYTI